VNNIPVYSPWRAKNTAKYLQQVVDSNWFTSGGKFYQAATEQLQELLDVKHVLLLNSGTSACDLMVQVYRKLHPGTSKFYMPDGVYAAAWNSALRGARISDVTQYEFIDLDPNTWNAYFPSLSDQDFSSAVVLNVHNLGNPNPQPHIDPRQVLEDNCEGLFGSYFNGEPTGIYCRASACSFFGNKIVTCGEGGALATNDTEFYELAKLIHGQGQGSKKFIHETLGNNYRLTNTAAAILLSQLESLDDIKTMKLHLFRFYRENLKNINCEFQQTARGCQSANWMFGVKFSKQSSYEQAEKFFAAKGIETRPMFYPAVEQPYLRQMYIWTPENPNAKMLNEKVVILPSFPDIAQFEMDHVVETAKQYADFLERQP